MVEKLFRFRIIVFFVGKTRMVMFRWNLSPEMGSSAILLSSTSPQLYFGQKQI
jgi:hypothetical protein